CLLVPDRRCAACSTAAFSMSAITTLAPASARAVAMPRPIPEAAPVTMAVLPEISMPLPPETPNDHCRAHATALPFLQTTGGQHGKAPDVSAARQCVRPQRRAVEEVVRGSAWPARLRVPTGLGRVSDGRRGTVARGGADAAGRRCAPAVEASGGPEPHGL